MCRLREVHLPGGPPCPGPPPPPPPRPPPPPPLPPTPTWILLHVRQENERFRKQLREISRVVSAYASNRVARDDETKSELKELKAAHQKRLNRTFESNYAERQYYSSFSGEQVDLEEARIDNDAESE